MVPALLLTLWVLDILSFKVFPDRGSYAFLILGALLAFVISIGGLVGRVVRRRAKRHSLVCAIRYGFMFIDT